MESAKQRFFHLLNDFAYIEVSNPHPRPEGLCSLRRGVSFLGLLSQMTANPVA